MQHMLTQGNGTYERGPQCHSSEVVEVEQPVLELLVPFLDVQ